MGRLPYAQKIRSLFPYKDSSPMKLSASQVIRFQQKSLDALAAHYVEKCMDDSEYIQLVRVLVSAAVAILLEDGEPDAVIGPVESTLREYARGFFVSRCIQQHDEISNPADYQEETEALFDYIYQNGQYPDE
jgi:hypothetical protein